MSDANSINENRQATINNYINNDDLDELDLAIAELTGVDNVQTPIRLQNDESFVKIFGGETLQCDEKIKSQSETVIERDFDSSDEEGVKNFLEQKYNQYGRQLNKNLKLKNAELRDAEITREVNTHIKVSSEGLFNKNKKRVSNGEPVNGTKLNNKEKRILPTAAFKPLQQQIQNGTSNPFRTVPSQQTENSQPAISGWLQKVDNNVYKDPVFGMRLINPLVSSSVLVERMEGRKPVSMAGLQYHIDHADLSNDWVVAGAIVSKCPVKETQKGGSYIIWKISDLKGDIKMVSLFLFRSAFSGLWKTPVGSVIAALNPRVFDKRDDRNDIAALCIDKENQVMILGKSKDFGICKAKKKNGENCTSIINLSECEYCVYHVKQEFGKMSKRSELQSSTAGRGLQELRNKILGKSEVFYAGQSFVAVPAKKSAKLVARDQKRMMSLSEYYHNPNAASVNHMRKEKTKIDEIPYASRAGIQSKLAGNVEIDMKQRLKDLERLKLLQEEDEKRKKNVNAQSVSAEPNSSSSSNTSATPSGKIQTPLSKLNGLESPKFSNLLSKTPSLKRDNFSLDVNLNSRKANAAKMKAVQLLKNKPLEKSNPNFVKYRGTQNGKKRVIDELNEAHNNPEAKRKKLEEERANEARTRIQKIMAATSSHANLVNVREFEEQEKYFNKLEKKEQLEEKMLNTYKIACKAVTCLKCKYTAFSAGDKCKEEHHALKVIGAEKRFFECQDCSNRTVSLDKMPKQTCKNCKSSRWKRAAMMKERKLIEPGANLCIRGDEEQFIGSVTSKGNLNLLVPEAE